MLAQKVGAKNMASITDSRVGGDREQFFFFVYVVVFVKNSFSHRKGEFVAKDDREKECVLIM